MKTGAAYIRVSTEDQIEFSPDSQLKKIQEYAAVHQILLPDKYIFLDEGISGRCAEKRPAFMRMINKAKEKPKPFDVILLWKFSRFARSRQDSILYKTMLRKECGIDVISITEQLSQDPTAILIEALLEAMDEYYSINLAQEVRRGMNEKFSRGGVVSSPPFGYRMGKECFEIDEKNGAVVRKIFEAYLDGKSCRRIADELNRNGILTARGHQFQSRSISYILSNPVYAGKLRRHTQPGAASLHTPMTMVDGSHTPLVSMEQFQKTQRLLNIHKKLYPQNASSTVFMLHGIVRCHSCGGIMVRTAKGKALQCGRYTKGQCRESHYISIEKINRLVLSALRKNITSPKLIFFLDGDCSEEEKNKVLRSLLSSIIYYKNLQKIECFFRILHT